MPGPKVARAGMPALPLRPSRACSPPGSSARPRGGGRSCPAAGSGYDVFALARAGFDAVGLDVAPTAAKRFEALRAERGLAGARIVIGDAFTHAPETRYDVIWDYTFCCALEPSERPRWAALMERPARPRGRARDADLSRHRGARGLCGPALAALARRPARRARTPRPSAHAPRGRDEEPPRSRRQGAPRPLAAVVGSKERRGRERRRPRTLSVAEPTRCRGRRWCRRSAAGRR